jgi:hypothetical protein
VTIGNCSLAVPPGIQGIVGDTKVKPIHGDEPEPNQKRMSLAAAPGWALGFRLGTLWQIRRGRESAPPGAR